METKKFAYLILKNLYTGKVLSARDLGIDKKEYGDILEMMQNNNLITGVEINRKERSDVIIDTSHEHITLKGIDYLLENTIPDQDYHILVSIDEHVEGLELNVSSNFNGKMVSCRKLYDHKNVDEVNYVKDALELLAAELSK